MDPVGDQFVQNEHQQGQDEEDEGDFQDVFLNLLAQDMFLAGTIILLISALTVIGTLISDILLVWVDPRIRLERR